ncbi:MAG TPA: serine--tRNA ligase, partial [Candidatus Latescibacteria bacterium]|nr:serine--tRNA ligase [Candidatus Latescibacterota bacterium]
MLDAKFVLENLESVQNRLAARGPRISLEEFVRVSREKKDVLKKVEDLRAEKNRVSEEISRLKKDGKDASSLIAAMRGVGDEIAGLEEKLKTFEDEIKTTLLNIPNIPHESVPVGRGSEDNKEVRRFGCRPEFGFKTKAHWEVGEKLGILDFERASKITGSRFALYFGAGAHLERALIGFMLDMHTRERGFMEVLPPFIVNAESLTGTGNLPKFKEDLFKLEGFDWYLIPTAEVPLTNIYRNEILDGAALPTRFVAYTPCFRSEAGSYGKDVRGLIRQHQFNKVEMMIFSRPEGSFEELEYMTASAEEVLKRLGLHHRVVLLSTGDMGFASAKTYDLEVWMPSRDGFMEISSCSNCIDFQARRAGIRFRREPRAKPEFVHTLNGSGLAVGRTVSAILENFQQADGSVVVPEALRSYMNGLERISA